MIVKQTGVGGDGERLEEPNSIAVMQSAPVHPLEVGREQKGSTYLYQGKARASCKTGV